MCSVGFMCEVYVCYGVVCNLVRCDVEWSGMCCSVVWSGMWCGVM